MSARAPLTETTVLRNAKPRRVTMNSVNAAIRTLDLELVKGDAYFYFAGLGENAARVDLLDNTSVYTPFLTDLSLCEWEDEALLIAERVENFDA